MQNEEEDLIRRLNLLTIEKKRIETRLSEIKKSEKQLTKDRDGNTINIGDTILFLTKGKYHSTRGTVTRINERRITAKDKRGNLISRAPHNTRRIETGKHIKP
jgi:hypothetical protein